MSTSADLKIERANHHREQLLADLEAFRDRKPYLIRERVEERGDLIYRFVSAEDAEPPPAHIALVRGDFVQNLRASLDHLVGAMLPDGPSRDSAFPICVRKDGDSGFDRVSARKLAGIPDDAKDVIESKRQMSAREMAARAVRALCITRPYRTKGVRSVPDRCLRRTGRPPRPPVLSDMVTTRTRRAHDAQHAHVHAHGTTRRTPV